MEVNEFLAVTEWLIRHALVIITLLVTITVLCHLLTWIEEKGICARKEKNLLDRQMENETLRFYHDNLKYCNDMLDTIVTQITLKVQKKIRELNSVGERYQMLQMDKDIEKISSSIFNGLNPEVFNNMKHTYTEEYLMAFIVSTTRMILSEESRKLNSVSK